MVTVKLRVYKFYKEQHAKVNIRDADREDSFIHSFLYSVCIFCCCFCVTDLLFPAPPIRANQLYAAHAQWLFSRINVLFLFTFFFSPLAQILVFVLLKFQ